MSRLSICTMIILLHLFIIAGPAQAISLLNEEFNDYSKIDIDQTTAHIDTVNNWARLPNVSLASAVTMLRDSLGYVVASKDGIQVYELDDSSGTLVYNSVFSIPSAVTATGMAVRQDNLNIWATTPDSLTYYRFNGSGMSPSLNVTGLDNIVSVAGFHDRNSAILLQKSTDNKAIVKRYDSGTAPTLTIKPDITDPVAVSMVGSSPDFRIFTKNSSYYFYYDDATGNYIEDPGQKISGLVDVISGSSDEQGNSVLSPTDLNYYINMDGGGSTRVDALSPGNVAGGVAAALRPGSFDQVVLDQTGNVRWWTYDDANDTMVRDPLLEKSGFTLNKGYVAGADYVSGEVTTGGTTYSLVRLKSSFDMPAGTGLTWKISTDNGGSYIDVNLDEWTAVPETNSFKIMCLLSTSNTLITPYIYSVLLEVNSAPDPPTLPDYGDCFGVTTPELTWTFSDDDHPVPGDKQSAYQVQVAKASDLSVVLDTGKVLSDLNSYTVPTSIAPDSPGPLWASGTNEFVYRVKVWDMPDAESPWSLWGDFCVLAFERPRVSEIVSAPAGEPKPASDDPASHIVILEAATAESLPKAKAGTKIGILLDSVGSIDTAGARFPYLATSATLAGPPNVVQTNGINDRWLVEFWADPNKDVCPDGTVVTMEYEGDTAAGEHIELFLPPYADGVVQISGTVFEDWMVILRGRDNL